MKATGLNNYTQRTMKGKKLMKLDKVFPDGTRTDVVSQEITHDFVLEIFERAKKARSKKKKEELLAVAETLSKNIGKWLVE
jgi:propanediol dehydratase small subunit